METSINPAGHLATLPDHIQSLIKAVKSRLEIWYKSRLDRIILYGSYARGDYHEESDIDLLIILKDKKVSRLQEINDLVALKYDLMISNNILLSTKAVTESDYKNRPNAIYYFIRREGIVL
ncbi:nucleotidyltransferase domain-containing protein [Larkinella humicola]|uniref:Nucleotidyltransferase domain-containing protein n=1 Tax=Larkinella humicola TaxID=2607654 RepID=A0A5N1JCI6_9BACT|nr:nucleotidyltransferase domain-containing protein [Larkinella humicola]KAA9352984.1 nucleotidyltransferase domain-containing protein [Larkinella humicola]